MADEPAKKLSLDEALQEWLRNQGYPLEFACANVLRQAGLHILQGGHIKGTGGEFREVDVMGTNQVKMEKGKPWVFSSILCECKYLREGNPWVVLYQQEVGHPVEHLARASMSKGASTHLLSRMYLAPRYTVIDLFNAVTVQTDIVGFAVIEAFRKDNRDIPFDALMKVADLAQAVNESSDTLLKPLAGAIETKPEVRSLVLPCVVVKGGLFAAGYDPESAHILSQRIKAARVHTQGGRSVYVIDSEHFAEFVNASDKVLKSFTAIMERVS